MSLTDRLLLGEIGIEGEFEIGITNPLTGRLYRHVKSKNVITDGMYEYLRMVQWDLLRTLYLDSSSPRCQCGISRNSGVLGGYPYPAIHAVHLTDGSLPEDQTRRVLDGNTIAYGTSNASVSTDTKLGVITPSECYALYNRIVRRWDFPSDKGNGTFSKICLASPYEACRYDVIAVGASISGSSDAVRYGYFLNSQPFVYYSANASTRVEKHLLVEGGYTKTTLVSELKKPNTYDLSSKYRIDGNTDMGLYSDTYRIALVDFTTGDIKKGGYYSDWKYADGSSVSSEILKDTYRPLWFYYDGKAYWHKMDYGFYVGDYDTMLVSRISTEVIDDFNFSTSAGYTFEFAIKGNNIYVRNNSTKALYKIDGSALKRGSVKCEMIAPYATMFGGVYNMLYDVVDGECAKFFHVDPDGYTSNTSPAITYMPKSSGISRVPFVDNAGSGPNASQLQLMAEKLLPEPITKDNMPMYVSYTLKLV